VSFGYGPSVNNGTNSIDYAQLTNWNTTLDGSLWLGSVTKSTGGDASWTLNVPGNFTLIDGASLSSTSGKLNLTINADSTNNSYGGGIDLGAGSSVYSNGGNIFLGGGSSGYAISFNNTRDPDINVSGGIVLASATTTVDAAGGNIVMNGEGQQNSGQTFGIYSNGLIETAGSGSITLNGLGGNGRTQSYDIFLANASITTTGSGNITLNNVGPTIADNGFATSGNSNLIGGSMDTGRIQLIADTLSYSTYMSGPNTVSGLAIETSGNVTIGPNSSGQTVGLAGGSGGLNIGTTLLQATNAGSFTFGDLAAGTMNVSGYNWSGPVTMINAEGPMNINGDQVMGANNLTLETNNLVLGSNHLTGSSVLTIGPSIETTEFHINDGTMTGLYLTGQDVADMTNNWSSIIFGNMNDAAILRVGANTWGQNVSFLNGTGNIEFSGAQSLSTHTLQALASSGNITLDQNSPITSTASSGNSILLATSGNFYNLDTTDMSTALSPGNGARFLVYSNDPNVDTYNGLDAISGHIFDATYASDAPNMVSQTGSQFIFAQSPSLLVTIADSERLYGAANPIFTYTVSGFLFSDNATTVSGSPFLSTTAGMTSGVGSYSILGSLNSLTSAEGYSFHFADGTLTIAPTPLTVTADNKTIVAGAPDPQLTYTYTGLVAGDMSANFSGALAYTGDGVTAGTYSILQNTLVTSGNYMIGLFNPGTFTIDVVSAPVVVPPSPTTVAAVLPQPVTTSVNSVINSVTQTSLASTTPTTTATTTTTPTSAPLVVAETGNDIASNTVLTTDTSLQTSPSNGQNGATNGTTNSGPTTNTTANTQGSNSNSATLGSANGAQSSVPNGTSADSSEAPSSLANLPIYTTTPKLLLQNVVWDNQKTQNVDSIKFDVPTVCYSVNELYVKCKVQKVQ
jgi:hypothetical protein